MSGSLRQKLVTKSEVLVLRRPKSRKHPFIYVRVAVERGRFYVQSQGSRCSIGKPKVDAQHDLKLVWVNDLLDDEASEVKNCFVVVTPEDSYILQASTHRVKIEWMQSLSIAISQALRFRGSYRPSSWSNLDDLQKWLTVREVQYRFQAHDRYKGAEYRGKWNTGMAHICGSMKWPSGDQYDGEFVYGKFHGTGTMRWLSDKQKRSYTGSWQDGKMEGYGEMMYADHSVYTGWWHLGRRQGHGRMEYRSSDSVYSGRWESDMRSGYGVHDNSVRSERYLGMWKNDKYHGAGILVARNKFFYSGVFANGEKSITSGPTVIVQDDKWDALFLCCAMMLEQMVSVCHSSPAVSHPQDEASPVANGAVPQISYEDIGTSPDMDASCQMCHATMKATEECVVCRVEGFKSADHPFGILVNNLTKCFTDSYSGVGIHKNLLPHAIGELYSITVRLHQLVRRHCPSVITNDENNLLGRPTSQLTMLLKSKLKLKKTSSHGSSDPSWLHPILLPSIFPTLFSLYKEHYSENDHKLTQLLSDFNHSSDEELCELLEIQSEYIQFTETHSEEDFDGLFQGAVQIFQKISEYHTPLNKLLCVQEANGEIMQVWRAETGQESALAECTSDVKLVTSTNLFTLVIIKSQVEHLSSEIQFIQDFAGTTLLTEEYGFLLTLLKDCIFKINDMERQQTPSN